jgi:hypothetical protein
VHTLLIFKPNLIKKKFEKKFSSFLANFDSELNEKGHEPSRAELKILQLELWLEPARLGLITSSYSWFYLVKWHLGKFGPRPGAG